MLIKLSAAVLAAVGAKTADEFPEALVKLLTSNTQALAANTSLAEKITALESANKTLLDGAAESKKTITALETKISGLSALKEEDVIKLAEAKGNEAAVKALAATGTGSPVAPAAPANAGAEQSQSKQLEAQGKFEEQWAADKNIQAEFPDPKGYASFMKHQAKGHIKIARSERP